MLRTANRKVRWDGQEGKSNHSETGPLKRLLHQSKLGDACQGNGVEKMGQIPPTNGGQEFQGFYLVRLGKSLRETAIQEECRRGGWKGGVDTTSGKHG